MSKKFFSIFLLFLLLPVYASADFDRNDLTLVDGFSWACDDGQLQEIMSATVVGSLRLVDCALISSDVEKWNAGEQIMMEEYFTVVSVSDKYKKFNTKKIFNTFKDIFSKQFLSLIEENRDLIDDKLKIKSEKISEIIGQQASFDVVRTLPLGELYNNKKGYSFATLTTSFQEVEGEKEKIMQVTAMTLIRKKKNLIFNYYYRDYRDEKDIDLAKAFVAEWIKKNK